MGMILARQLHLPEPAGSRAVVGGANGPALPVFSTRGMLHAAVPAGYQLRYVSPVVSGFGRSSRTPGGCTQFYSSATATLTIVQAQGPLGLPVSGGQQTVAITVRGHRGLATVNAITWPERGQYLLITVTPDRGTGRVMTTSQLIAVAGRVPLG
jgi:hypothetical protein